MNSRNVDQAVSLPAILPEPIAMTSLSGRVKAGLMLLLGALCEMLGMMFS